VPLALEITDLDAAASTVGAPAAAGIARAAFIDVVDAAIAPVEALVRDVVTADADIVAEADLGARRHGTPEDQGSEAETGETAYEAGRDRHG
jgi:hypothetical protein